MAVRALCAVKVIDGYGTGYRSLCGSGLGYIQKMDPKKYGASQNHDSKHDDSNAYFFIWSVTRRGIRPFFRFFILFSLHGKMSLPVTFVLYLSTRIGNKTVI